jgi:hypothetical protein
MYHVQQMTFRDLQKLVSQSKRDNIRKELFQRLQGKPFWIWDKQQHRSEDIKTEGNCCFNHIIGLPRKDSVDKPLYDYQGMIFDSLVSQHGNTSSAKKVVSMERLSFSIISLAYL